MASVKPPSPLLPGLQPLLIGFSRSCGGWVFCPLDHKLHDSGLKALIFPTVSPGPGMSQLLNTRLLMDHVGAYL